MRKTDILISLPVTGDEEWMALQGSLRSGWLTSGPKVREFEQAFALRHGVKHAISTTSATTALHLALVALGIMEGDEVIVPAFTWVATANAVEYCGATPVFVDVSIDTFNIDPTKIAEKLSPKTKAIIAVHLFGLCADMDAIAKVAPGIPVIEDAACAAGAEYKGRSAGGLGKFGCFSFHPRKIITTGEGGMLTTDEPKLAEAVSSLKNHGASISEEQRHNGPRPYLLPEFEVLGYNYRMTDLQGAIGTVQLSKLDNWLEERRKWAAFYNEQLSTLSWLALPNPSEGYGHSWQSYVTSLDPGNAPLPRNQLMEKLKEEGIHTRPGTHALHMLSYYSKRYQLQPEDFPCARYANDQTMAIPLHNRMISDDYERIVQTLLAIR
jgi:perosamine synthetase